MSNSARAIEQQLQGISAHGDGTWDWQFNVLYLDLGGTYGDSYQQSVFVNHSSKVALPTTTSRASAYTSWGNNASGRANNMQTLTPVSLITFLDL